MSVIINSGAKQLVVTYSDQEPTVLAFAEVDHLVLKRTDHAVPDGEGIIWQCYAVTKKQHGGKAARVLLVNNTEKETKEKAKHYAKALDTTVKIAR